MKIFEEGYFSNKDIELQQDSTDREIVSSELHKQYVEPLSHVISRFKKYCKNSRVSIGSNGLMTPYGLANKIIRSWEKANNYNWKVVTRNNTVTVGLGETEEQLFFETIKAVKQ